METQRLEMLRLVASDDRNVAARLAERLGITRQAASARLLKAIQAGDLVRTGRGAGVRYTLATQVENGQSYTRAGLDEDQVWRRLLLPVVADLPENVRDVWHYGLTEMVNNAIDHSGSAEVHVLVRRNALFTQVVVMDDGEGIFLRIQRALDLFDPREAILELAKGKFTTDPDNHSGEGIFFASKVFDVFDITSGQLHFTHDVGQDDVLMERAQKMPGTNVFMQLDNNSPRTTREVFDRFAVPDEFAFAKTIVPVKLGQYEGEKLVSRSQAKRLTMRFEKFKTVILDFEGVMEIGQGFADEVFRVFQNAHPGTSLAPVNMTAGVASMVERAVSAHKAQGERAAGAG